METELDKVKEFATKQMQTDVNAHIGAYSTIIDFIDKMQVKNLDLGCVSKRFSAEQMAEWFHNNYEEIAKAEGWQTQDKCKVEFKDLPESNRITMIKVCEHWLNGC